MHSKACETPAEGSFSLVRADMYRIQELTLSPDMFIPLEILELKEFHLDLNGRDISLGAEGQPWDGGA